MSNKVLFFFILFTDKIKDGPYWALMSPYNLDFWPFVKKCKGIIFFFILYLLAVAGSGKVGPVNRLNHTSWVTVDTPTDCPESVHNRCVIELFGDVFVLSRCPFDISVGIGAFVIGLSQISSFFSKYNISNFKSSSSSLLSEHGLPCSQRRRPHSGPRPQKGGRLWVWCPWCRPVSPPSHRPVRPLRPWACPPCTWSCASTLVSGCHGPHQSSCKDPMVEASLICKMQFGIIFANFRCKRC